ncbi:hypothetical protein [Xanthovirga aplysinae]|uniref:hypothetical protein n=1 Tax=Xanthovirga aplysinae TaxID=2529853 RepID=UPI0012BBDBE8|nr:hypothetical protein [Xanthovirga aplysinae]MTI30796.1 hypothetical protein [Xanthovirga aplysinae]
MLPQILENKDQLLKASEKEVIAFLGKPDNLELYSKSQKFYIYYISPSQKCPSGDPNNTETILKIRINSLGYANEITVEKQ